MSLTPLDESDRESREGGPAARNSEEDGALAEVIQRVRGTLGRVVTALSSRSGSRETSVEQREGSTVLDGPDAPGSGARSAERSLTWTGNGASEPPEPADPVDRPELVASWGDDGLVLSEDGDEDAAISSDTWTDIER
ncbi:hypothetical protein BRC67_11295 [Halobacteriales archaeon QH_3_68_24]|nr:MAG: hypothetical protein BRC67_11295 [Halobacteriales archaeon QH_3_68_24]